MRFIPDFLFSLRIDSVRSSPVDVSLSLECSVYCFLTPP